MARFGGRKRVKNLITDEEWADRWPTERGSASDLSLDAGVSVWGRLLKIDLRLRDKAGAIVDSVNYTNCTVVSMLPALPAWAICEGAEASSAVTLTVCLSILVASMTAGMAVFAYTTRRRRTAAAPARVPPRRAATKRQVLQSNEKGFQRAALPRPRRGNEGRAPTAPKHADKRSQRQPDRQ